MLELLKNDCSINVLHNDLPDIAHLFYEKGEYKHAAHFYHFAYKNPPPVQ
ncbi:tetratricopeptide repeat protein [Microaerobacter geothermalis]|nr:tetratricopeptide repeat protein [Microaerobacter geothermalis]